MKGYVYLLQSETGRRYVGSTNNIDRRLGEHKRKNSNSKYTKTDNNWNLVYKEEYNSLEEARLIEKGIKKNKSERRKFYMRSKSGISSVG